MVQSSWYGNMMETSVRSDDVLTYTANPSGNQIWEGEFRLLPLKGSFKTALQAELA
jgi:hypothetical protein